MTVTGEELIEKLKAISNDKEWSETARKLAKIEDSKRNEIESLIAEFKNIPQTIDSEDFEEEVLDILCDLASDLDMDTENMRLDLEEGVLEWWVNSYC